MPSSEIKRYESEHFFQQEIMLDEFHHYFKCTFHACTFIYNGSRSFILQGCAFSGGAYFHTDSPQIANAISILKSFGFLEHQFARSWRQGTQPPIIGLH